MTGTEYKNRILEKYPEETRTYKNAFNWEDFYMFSNDGLIKSLARIIIRKNGKILTVKERILKPGQKNNGYFIIVLCKNGKSKTYLVNQLICTAFHGTCPEGMECRHKDNNPINNHADNLEWVTHTENMHDRIANGTTNRGEQNGMAKLTQEKVDEIRELYATGNYSQYKLGIKFNISHQHVSELVNYINWKH